MDDASKIIRAENRAIRKKKSKNKLTPRQNPSNHVSVPSYVPPPPLPGDQQPWYTSSPVIQGGYAGKTQRGPCFNCGSYKHWRANCPYLNYQNQHKFVYDVFLQAYESDVQLLPSPLLGNVDLLMHLLCVSKADNSVQAYYSAHGTVMWLFNLIIVF